MQLLILFLILSGTSALLIRLGFALYAAGMVRAKNSAGAVFRLICDLCGTTLAFWAVGAAFIFQSSGANAGQLAGAQTAIVAPYHAIFNFAPDHLFGNNLPWQFIPLLVVILTGSGALSGAVAERVRFFPLSIASISIVGIVLPIELFWTNAGWLSARRFFDPAGAASIHMSIGIVAAVACYVVGPRTGKYNRDGSTTMIPGHNVPMAAIGALLVVVGWLPFIAGQSVTADDLRSPIRGVVNVLLAASAGGLSSVMLGHYRYRKPDIILSLMGFVGAAIAASGGAWLLPSWAAVIVGAAAGIVVPLAALSLDLYLKLDDPLGVIAMHGVGGALGSIAVGFFGQFEAGESRMKHIFFQLVGVIALAMFSFICSLAVFLPLKKFARIRASETEEFEGLDLAELDIGGYPDFQQTMIKSYHLREV